MNSLLGQKISKCWKWLYFPFATPCYVTEFSWKLFLIFQWKKTLIVKIYWTFIAFLCMYSLELFFPVSHTFLFVRVDLASLQIIFWKKLVICLVSPPFWKERKSVVKVFVKSFEDWKSKFELFSLLYFLFSIFTWNIITI